MLNSSCSVILRRCITNTGLSAFCGEREGLIDMCVALEELALYKPVQWVSLIRIVLKGLQSDLSSCIAVILRESNQTVMLGLVADG